MEPKAKGKFATSSKMKIFQNPFCKKNEIIYKLSQKTIVGYHDALQIYGAPNLCTVMY